MRNDTITANRWVRGINVKDLNEEKLINRPHVKNFQEVD